MSLLYINKKDKKLIKIFKLLYLMPIVLITYPFFVITEGVKEVGNVFDEYFIDIIKSLFTKDPNL